MRADGVRRYNRIRTEQRGKRQKKKVHNKDTRKEYRKTERKRM
jgi:hypothetical protein